MTVSLTALRYGSFRDAPVYGYKKRSNPGWQNPSTEPALQKTSLQSSWHVPLEPLVAAALYQAHSPCFGAPEGLAKKCAQTTLQGLVSSLSLQATMHSTAEGNLVFLHEVLTHCCPVMNFALHVCLLPYLGFLHQALR